MSESDFLISEVLGLLGQVALAFVISRLFVQAGQSKWIVRVCWLIPILYVFDRAAFFKTLDGGFRSDAVATATGIVGLLVPFLPALFLLWLLKARRQSSFVSGTQSEGST